MGSLTFANHLYCYWFCPPAEHFWNVGEWVGGLADTVTESGFRDRSSTCTDSDLYAITHL
jgi:hypothetical protein